jgi:RNA polymerase sigma factor (sigma-70 family)
MENKTAINPEDHMGLLILTSNKLYKQYSSRVTYEDFQQVLSLGLVIACKKYKPELGFAFSTFACRVMHVEVLKYLRKDGLSVSRTEDKYKGYNISTFTDVFTNSQGKDRELDSLEILVDKNEFENFEDKLVLKEALKQLEPKYRVVIIEQFYNRKTQTELAAKYGVSQIEISRRKTKGLQQLKKLLTA